MTYMSLCVVMTDWGNLRDEIFSRTGFAPSAFELAPIDDERVHEGRAEAEATRCTLYKSTHFEVRWHTQTHHNALTIL